MGRLMGRLALALLIALLAAGAYIWRSPLATWGSAAWNKLTGTFPDQGQAAGLLIASGVIEGQAIDVAAPVSGRIAALHVSEGQSVAAGQLVAELDTALLDAQIKAAAEAEKVAEAQAGQVRAGPREADLAVARAAVGQAEAGAAAAAASAKDARALVHAPSALDVAIARAETALSVASEQANAAAAAATAADLEQQLMGRIVQRLEQGVDVSLPPEMGGGSRHFDAPADKLAEARLQWNLKSQAAWEAHAQQAAALAARDAARQALADLRGRKVQPVTLEGQARAAEAALPVTEAAVEAARASLRLLQAGATVEQVAIADAAVAQAAASRRALEAKRLQYTVLAPGSGGVSEVVLHEGEVAVAGAPIARLRATRVVTLTAYVPEPRMGEVRLGGPVAVAVDAFPGRTFGGTVTNVAGEAEFTPKNVQTRGERAGTVFAVKVSLPNEDAALKAGMPADAFFCPGPTACEYPYAALAEAGAGEVSNLVARVFPRPLPTAAMQPGSPPEAYSGSLEATAVRPASEVGGRAVAVLAAEGDKVGAGQVLVTVAGEELVAQRAEAEAAVAAAKAELLRVEAKPQPERVQQAEANVRQAEAAVAAAQARLAAAVAERYQPQELDGQINSARQQIATAAAGVDAARAQVKAAQVLQDSLQDPGSDEDKTRRAGYDAQATAAAARLRAAEAQLSGAKAVLVQLSAIRADPAALDAAVHQAEGEVAIAEAGLATARAAAAQVDAAPQAEAIAVARARVAQAEAARDAVDAALAKLQVRSPIDGEVTMQAIHTGEVVNAGVPLFSIADLTKLRLTVYVPLSEIGGVRVGQAARVTADPYPGRDYAGTVTRLADRAQYTPKNVQTAEERAQMVIPVEVMLENADGSLRPGMGAEARW